MYRFLLRPRWLGLELLTVVVVVVFLLLSRWQYDTSRQVDAPVPRPTAASARPITAVVPDGSALLAADVGAGVTVTGTFDPASQRLVGGEVHQGRTGSWVVTLLRPSAAGEAAVLVARGWIPAGTTAPAPPTGTVRVLGWLGGADDPGIAAGILRIEPGYLPGVAPSVLANEVSYPVGDGFIGQTALTVVRPAVTAATSTRAVAPAALRSAAPAALAPVGVPAGGVSYDWENLGYAIQWVFFAAAAVGVLGFGARKEATRRASTAADLQGRTELRL